MAQLQNGRRIVLAITTYFISATASLLWILHRATPATSHRSWVDFVNGAVALWDAVLPSEANVLAVFVFLNFFISALAMAAVITSAIFLGRLSLNESRRLSHRLIKYAIFKMVFVGSVITPDPRDIAVWLAWFSVVGYLRIFLGAAKDRLESLLIAPGAQLGRHVRGVCLLVLVLVHNAASFCTVLRLLPRQSMARMLLCAFDFAVIAIEGVKTLLRYSVHMTDRYMCLSALPRGPATPADAAGTGGDDVAPATASAGGSEPGGSTWASSKGSFLYHVELVADVLVHIVTLAHYLHVWVLHGLSFHIIDAVLFLDMRAVLLSLLRRLRVHLTYRAATHRINNTFPDVHVSASAAGSTDCTICMDEIVHVAKQLPCGHVFHLSCLRAWLQQSGSETFTCPNCRQPIMVAGASGAEEEEGGRRREAAWWLVRAADRAYVRLVVAVEPLLLSVLLRWTLWLGGRAQNRRRVVRLQPAQPREGFGESPGPPPNLPTGIAAEYPSGSDHEVAEEDLEDDEENEEAEHVEETRHDLYRGSISEGCASDRQDRDSRDADSDADVRGSAEVAGRVGRDEAFDCAPARTPASPQEPKRWHPGERRPGEVGALCLGCEAPDSRGRRARRTGIADCGTHAGALAGPSAATAATARYRSRSYLQQPAPEVPSYSGDVLPRQAAAAARQLGRAVATSIRSSWGVGGVCAGAVAAGPLRGGDESDQEVCSRRRRVQTARRKRRNRGENEQEVGQAQ